MSRAWGGTGSPWRLILGWIDAAPWRTPPSSDNRCIMGGPVGPAVHCRRPASGLWCSKHEPDTTLMGGHIDRSEFNYPDVTSGRVT